MPEWPVTIDETDTRAGQVGQAGDLLAVLAADDQALLPGDEADDLQVQATELVLVVGHDLVRQPGRYREVETGDVTVAPAQGRKRLDRPAILQVEFEPAGELRQQRHRIAVTGMQAQHRMGAGQQLLQLVVELRRHAVDLGAQAGFDPLLGP